MTEVKETKDKYGYTLVNKWYKEMRCLIRVAGLYEKMKVHQHYLQWIAADEPAAREVVFNASEKEKPDWIVESFAAQATKRLAGSESLQYFRILESVPEAWKEGSEPVKDPVKDLQEKMDKDMKLLIAYDLKQEELPKETKPKFPYLYRKDFIGKKLNAGKWEQIPEAGAELDKLIEREHKLKAHRLLEYNVGSQEGHNSPETNLFSLLNKWIVLPKTSQVPRQAGIVLNFLYPWLMVNDETVKGKLEENLLLTGKEYLLTSVQEPGLEAIKEYLVNNGPDRLQDEKFNAKLEKLESKLEHDEPLTREDLVRFEAGAVQRRMDIVHTINNKSNPLFLKFVGQDWQESFGKAELENLILEAIRLTAYELMGAKGETGRLSFYEAFPIYFKQISYAEYVKKNGPRLKLMKEIIKAIQAELGIEMVKAAVARILDELRLSRQHREELESYGEKKVDQVSGEAYRRLTLANRNISKLSASCSIALDEKYGHKLENADTRRKYLLDMLQDKLGAAFKGEIKKALKKIDEHIKDLEYWVKIQQLLYQEKDVTKLDLKRNRLERLLKYSSLSLEKRQEYLDRIKEVVKPVSLDAGKYATLANSQEEDHDKVKDMQLEDNQDVNERIANVIGLVGKGKLGMDNLPKVKAYLSYEVASSCCCPDKNISTFLNLINLNKAIANVLCPKLLRCVDDFYNDKERVCSLAELEELAHGAEKEQGFCFSEKLYKEGKKLYNKIIKEK